MQEDFLHYIWKHKAFRSHRLKTVKGKSIHINRLGQHNYNQGPDFFNAQIEIDSQLWAGNVEIHIKSSDWYAHNHEKDKSYDNVILHVVWEYDAEIYRKDNSEIPTLELKEYVNHGLLGNYKKLLSSKAWINCQNDFPDVDSFLLGNWLERLYIERLEAKAQLIGYLLKKSNNDWEAVLFKLLLKNFGLKVNGEAFLSIANSIDFAVFRKTKSNILQMEAILYGQSGLLENDIQNRYYQDLKKQYNFLKQKFNLTNEGVLPVSFFRLRPSNFPTIRLSQFVNLYNKEKNLFSQLSELKTKNEIFELFKVGVSDFWKSHYTFSKTSKESKKQLTKAFIDLLIINTIVPVKFAYAKYLGKTIDEEIIGLLREIKFEQNSISTKFLKLKTIELNALNSQGLLQLKQDYCDKNNCLQCAVGNSLIVKN